jgi:pimeloyl-ACP methyl ester carboxylesterase
MAPGNFNIADALVALEPKPPVLWIRGDQDLIVSDASLFDLAQLGKLGLVPGWPGDETAPAQPMIGQTRAVLHRYAEHGGAFTEVVFPACGHSPHIERPAEFAAHLSSLVTSQHS